jgi:transposase
MTEITTVGVDLSKEVIAACAADSRVRTGYFKKLGFAGFAQWAANLPPCVIGMEASSSTHHWARFLAQHGHTPRRMAGEHVKPFRRSQGAKKDRNVAQAVAVAVRQPQMRERKGLQLAQVARGFALDVLLAHSCKRQGVVLVTATDRDMIRIRRAIAFDCVATYPVPA